jgi:hypothetical protein
LPGNLCNTAESVVCPGCDKLIHADVFPALFREQKAGRKAEAILEAGVSSCFYHDGKKAVIPCDGCGRFLCALCDVELNGQHLCPSCVDSTRTKGTLINLERSRTVYDTGALLLAVVPIVLFPLAGFTIATGPAAVICGVMAFFRPGSLVRRGRLRAISAVLIGLVQCGLWMKTIFFL